ncbi:MAG: LolA family protein [Hyphomicrobiaceae bacterium]
MTMHLSAFGGLLRGAIIGLSLVAMALGAVGQASAQDEKKPPANPVGAGWDSKVQSTGATNAGPTVTEQQNTVIAIVNDYFNALANLRGRFVQVDADKKQTTGKFFVQKPGKFRFDYAKPSRKIVISDGRFLAIQDLDLRNEDVYELDNTPFRILLRSEVDILRDARVIEVQESAETVSLTLTDKDPDAPGQITVILTRQPQLELAGWITSDAQGLETRVDVSGLSRPEKLDKKLFKRETFFQDAFKQ